MRITKRIIALLLTVLLLAALCGCSNGQKDDFLDTVVKDTADVLLHTVTDPTVASIGGEWAVIGLARWGGEVPEQWFECYYNNLQAVVTEAQGILHAKKYTEYARVSLALTAMGKNPVDVAGYNLLKPLADFEQTIWQGINGPVWALIALDSGAWELPADPEVPVQASRRLYVQHIVDLQNDDGGWGLVEGGNSQSDLTAMALQALAKYTDDQIVAEAVERALAWLAQHRPETCEGAAQLTVALGELGIPLTDSRFAPADGSVVDLLLEYHRENQGFVHTRDASEINLMSTEQAFYALVSAKRQSTGESSLYRMKNGAGEQDAYHTDPVPEGKPQPVEPQDKSLSDETGTCTISINCATLLDNLQALDKNKHELVPADGVILPPTQVSFNKGESVFDLLQRVTRENKIHMEYVDMPLYNSAYIEGIANLYEFDAGNLSGWNYCVNGWFPNYGCSRYALQEGDTVEWLFTCDLGKDIGNDHLNGSGG